MAQQPKQNSRKLDWRLVGIAIFVLLICLFYNYVNAFWNPNPGLTINDDWIITDLPACNLAPEWCEANTADIRLGDQVVSVGELAYETFKSDRTQVPYEGYDSGDVISITYIRNGESQTVDWLMPPTTASHHIRSFLPPLLIYGPFWLVGSVILLFLRPRNTRWRLLVIFNYLIAVWLAVGIVSISRLASSSILLHALSWVFLPIFIHLHLEAPSPLVGSRSRYILYPLYSIAVVLMVLELGQFLPGEAFMMPVLFSILASFGILLYRTLAESQIAHQLASRQMLVGVCMAFGPGLMLWMLPAFLGISSPGLYVTTAALLALPLLPLTYLYAVYKQRLGNMEFRVNRLLSLYVIFLIYLVFISLVFVLGNAYFLPSNQTAILILLISFTAVLAILPLQGWLQRLINRLAYGEKFDPAVVLRVFASRIPAVDSQEALVKLLTEEINPTLGIHQSALYLLTNGETTLVFSDGVSLEDGQPEDETIEQLIKVAGEYRPGPNGSGPEKDGQYGWVRLSVLLIAREGMNGLWLFGSRDPDNYYRQNDIILLETLANQVAITIENGLLIKAVEEELAERERAEAAQARLAERLGLLHAIDSAVLAANSPQEIAMAAIGNITELIPCKRASISLFDFENQEIEVLAIHGGGQMVIPQGTRLPMAALEFTNAFRAGEVQVIRDLSALSYEKSEVVRDLPREGVRSGISVPLIASGDLIGGLSLWKERFGEFTVENIEIAQEVANSVAVALHHNSLLTNVTRQSSDLRQLSIQLIQAQESERSRISHELHDEMGQLLTAITYDLAAIERDLPSDCSPVVKEILSDTKSLVNQMMEQIRTLSLELRPSMLHDLGLEPTLRWYVNQYAERTNIAVDFKALDMSQRMPGEVETTLYRVVQEALTNVARHAQADHIYLHLAWENGVVWATIEDDGLGFDTRRILGPESSYDGAGLLGIRERVAALGGTTNIDSMPGKGTRLSVELPLEACP